VWKAQGKGCSPGSVGVCVGGDRTSGYLHAKEQLFRTLDDTKSRRASRGVEDAVMECGQPADRRPDGIRRKTSLIGCRSARSTGCRRASSSRIAYDCWAFRRLGVTLDAQSGAITSWLYRDGDAALGADADPLSNSRAGFPRTGREVRLQAPITDEQIRALNVGDVVLVSGRMYTGRDAVPRT
jgi:fumarate hydratase class I